MNDSDPDPNPNETICMIPKTDKRTWNKIIS